MIDEPKDFDDDLSGDDDGNSEGRICGYFSDDGTPLNPDLIPKPALCLSCRKNDDPYEEVLCNLTRLDQRNNTGFICFAYDNIHAEI